MNNKDYESLLNIKRNLCKYCHAPECRRPLECPERHSSCAKKLNDTTAMIWRLAENIAFFLDRRTLCTLFNLKNAANFTRHVLSYHYELNSEPRKSVVQLNNTLYDILRRIAIEIYTRVPDSDVYRAICNAHTWKVYAFIPKHILDEAAKKVIERVKNE